MSGIDQPENVNVSSFISILSGLRTARSESVTFLKHDFFLANFTFMKSVHKGQAPFLFRGIFYRVLAHKKSDLTIKGEAGQHSQIMLCLLYLFELRTHLIMNKTLYDGFTCVSNRRTCFT